MHKPRLLVIAGCNGSGKSSFSKYLVPSTDTIPFDYDSHSHYLTRYSELMEFDLKDRMAHNMAWEHGLDFAYETNFDNQPMYWPNQFKEKGYEIYLIYLCLQSIDLAVQRVAIRVENGGHYVPDFEVKRRYFAGFANLNASFLSFDFVDLFEGSTYFEAPTHILSLSKKNREFMKIIDLKYLENLIPNLLKFKY